MILHSVCSEKLITFTFDDVAAHISRPMCDADGNKSKNILH